MKIPGLSFSLKRAVGVSALKQKVARKTGLPLTKQGLERKIGGKVVKAVTGKNFDMIKKIFLLTFPVIILSCGQQAEKKALSESEAGVYQETLDKVKTLEGQLAGISSASLKEIDAFMKDVDGLRYLNDTVGMSTSGRESCAKLERRIGLLKRDALATVEQRLQTIVIPAEVNDDCLLEKTTAYPVYLEKGDILYYNIGLQKQGTVKLYNADARQLLKTYAQKTRVNDSLAIANKGIYLVEIVPRGTQYASINITYKMADHHHAIKKVSSKEVEAKAGGFRVTSNKGVVLRNAFDQPRKFTLSSQLKSTFSSAAKSKALVAVQIPAGATDVLYNLRISTSEQGKSEDGKFPDKMNLSYKKVRFLGLPLYESSRSNGLFSSLLDDNRPLREEDAYCNMYVFRSQTAAKHFQDGNKQASQLLYDVDYSTLGTQSCNGRIPAKGARTIYLAFENERVRYSIYLWVEVLTATPTTEYHSTKYTVE